MAFTKPSWETNSIDVKPGLKKPSWETPKIQEVQKPEPVKAEPASPEPAKPSMWDVVKTSLSRDVDKKTDLLHRLGATDEVLSDVYAGMYGKERPVGTGQAFMGGLTSGATLNTVGYTPTEFKEKHPDHKLAYTVGHIGGSLLPFGAAYKEAKPLATAILAKTAPKAVRPFAKAGLVAVPETARIALTGALAGAPIGAVEAAAEGGNLQDAAKNALLYAGIGGVGDVAVEKVLIPALKPVVGKIWQRFKGAPVAAELVEKEVAKDIGVSWENMNEAQREAIRKVVRNMQSEPVQSGRLLPEGKGINTFVDAKYESQYNDIKSIKKQIGRYYETKSKYF